MRQRSAFGEFSPRAPRRMRTGKFDLPTHLPDSLSHGVTDHCLDRREAPRTHRDLVARRQGFDRPISVARPIRVPAQSKVRQCCRSDHCCRIGHCHHYCRFGRLSPLLPLLPPRPGVCSGKQLVNKNAPIRVAAFSALRRARSIFGILINSGLLAKWHHMSWALYFIQAIGE